MDRSRVRINASTPKKIESQEREIAELLLTIHRMPDFRPERLPMAVVRLGARTGTVRGASVDDLDAFMRDLEMRRAAQTAETRVLVADALPRRNLRTALAPTPSSAVGIFTPSQRTSRGRMRAVFYGLCSACRRRPDFDARASARISAGETIGHAVKLASGSQPFPSVLERAEFLKQFSGAAA